MPTKATRPVQKQIMDALGAAKTELSLTDLVARVRLEASSGRNEVKAAVVPLLYRGLIELTPSRKFRIGS